MTISAELLRELHQMHKRRADVRDRLERGPKQIKAHEANVLRMEQEVDSVKEEMKVLRMSSDQKNLDLQSKESKIREMADKLASCSTNREFHTLQEQVAANKVAASVLEDEILDSLSKAEEYQSTVNQAESELTNARAGLEKMRGTITEQEQVLTADATRLDVDLQEAEANLPAEFREPYDRIVRAKKDDAMAEVNGDFCGGCSQQLTPNTVSKLHMSQVVFCLSCGRLIYLAESES